MTDEKKNKIFIPSCDYLVKAHKMNLKNISINVTDNDGKKSYVNLMMKNDSGRDLNDLGWGLIVQDLVNNSGYRDPHQNKQELKHKRDMFANFDGYQDVKDKTGKKLNKILSNMKGLDERVLDCFTEHEFECLVKYREQKAPKKGKKKSKDEIVWWLPYLVDFLQIKSAEELKKMKKEELRKMISVSYNRLVRQNEEFPPSLKLKFFISKDYEFLTKVWTNDGRQFSLTEEDSEDAPIITHDMVINKKKEQVKMSVYKALSKGPRFNCILRISPYIMDKQFGLSCVMMEMKVKEDIEKLKTAGKTNEDRCKDSDDSESSESEKEEEAEKPEAEETAEPEEPEEPAEEPADPSSGEDSN